MSFGDLKTKRRIFDISPLIRSELAVFPGDVSFERTVALDFQRGHHLALSSIKTTLHIGAHADAPSHYHREGVSIDQCPLETYLGDCQVLDVSPVVGPISVAHLLKFGLSTPRILFKTSSIKNVDQWQEEFTYLSVEAIDYLAQKGVRLIGIDTPSMDHSKSKDLGAHQAFYRHRMAILEGLVLDDVAEGLYQLIALPLKIQGAEASPVRAILITGEQ